MRRYSALVVLWLAGWLYQKFGRRVTRLANMLIHLGFYLGVVKSK